MGMTTNEIAFPLLTDEVRTIMAKRLTARLRLYAEYHVAESDFYAAEAEKPQGLRHTMPYCVHGVSRWADYDCACFACEEGYGSWSGERETEDAYFMAVAAVKERDRRQALAMPLYRERGIDTDLTVRLVQWSWEPVTQACKA